MKPPVRNVCYLQRKITSPVQENQATSLRNNGELLLLMAEMLGTLSAFDCMGCRDVYKVV